jgi:hypothetical protein
MNSTNNASANAGQMASTEANAADTAQVLDMELDNDNDSYEYDPDAPLKDYNEGDDEDPVPDLRKSTNGKKAASSEDKEIKKISFKRKARAKRICATNHAYG